METRPLSPTTITELIALEDRFFHFFKANAKDIHGLQSMSEESVHQEFTRWLNQAPAFIGTFHLHGSSVLRSLVATILMTMDETEEAEKIMHHNPNSSE